MKKSALFASFALIVALVVVACSAPAASPPQVVKETVVVPQTVVAEQTVVAQQTVVVPATAAPGAAAEKVLRVNIATYPDIIDPQKSSFVNEIAHLSLIYEGLTKFNEKLETVPGAA